MLRAFRRRAPAVDVERAAGEPRFWPQFSTSNQLGGGARNPMGIPAFYRGLAHRVAMISTLPLNAEVDGETVGVPIEILERPDPTEDRQTTLARLESSLVLRGEFVCVLGGFDADGFPTALKPVDPSHAILEDSGSWTINGRRFPAASILHVVPMAMPGETRGVSVVELFRRTFTGEVAAQDFQSNFYLDGGQPTTVLVNSDPDATKEDIEEMLQRYLSKVAGGRREPIALPSTIEVKTMGLTNHDSQFLESRQFAITDMANIVGVPPYFIGAPGSSSVYSNLTDQRRDLLDVYLRGDMYAIERGFSSLLPDGLVAKFDPKSFLRMDPRATADTLSVELQWMTVNEVRAVQGLAPVDGGDGVGPMTASGVTQRDAGDVAKLIQQMYLGVGTVVTADEVREILNQFGAGLVVPAPDEAKSKLGATIDL